MWNVVFTIALYIFWLYINSKNFFSTKLILYNIHFLLRLVARNDGAPAWADTGVILTWHMYRMYGDVQIILDNYQNMVKWMSYLSGSNPSMIWENNLSANYGDWLSVNSSTPKEIVSTSYFAYDALLMSYLAKAIGKSADANMYGQLHKKIAEAFNNKFVNKTSGRIEGNTQSCYVLALTCGLLADDLVPKAVQYLVDDIISHDMHLTTGFIGKLCFTYHFFNLSIVYPLAKIKLWSRTFLITYTKYCFLLKVLLGFFKQK